LKVESGNLKANQKKRLKTAQERRERKQTKSLVLRSLCSFSVIFLLACSSFAADVTLTVNPSIIVLNKEAAQIKVEVRNADRVGAPSFPRVNGLNFSGTGRSINQRIVNGVNETTAAYTTTVYPQQTGDYQIGPFSYTVDGETKQLTGTLKVVASSGAEKATPDKQIFAALTTNREKVYVQEPFELTFSIYSLIDVNLPDNLLPSELELTGLSKTSWTQIPGHNRTIIDGVLYNVSRFKSPMRAMGSGEFEFPSVMAVNQVDSFFNRTVHAGDLAVEELSINILPLPSDGKPNGFTGVVGRFQLEATANPTTVAPGDPITLQMTIVGEGNYDRIQPPALPIDAPFRLFGDAVRQQGNNGVRFEQVISPRDATATKIPSIDFSFFDSESGSYRTISSIPIPITVTASSNNTAQLFATKENGGSVAPADTPFASESDIQRITKWFKTQWKIIRPWLWTLPASLGIGAVLFGIQKLIHWRRKDVAWARRQKAPKAARNALKTADAALRKNDATAFYEALGSALNAYFGNRLNLAPGDVTPTVVLTALQKANVETAPIQTLFDQIEAARYGRTDSQKSSEHMKTQKCAIEHLLKQMEKTRF
jgi:hypothetical protein